jgi:hypothetical protein
MQIEIVPSRKTKLRIKIKSLHMILPSIADGKLESTHTGGKYVLVENDHTRNFNDQKLKKGKETNCETKSNNECFPNSGGPLIIGESFLGGR